ncbi:hypothetical protein TGGT1_300080 [Toxoplasma gondii GT1]|uniref:Uncharacterized protein n=5 Tax=Toxoplasma gondii TaxID=5811 RepID=S7VUW8_TOXGG|nr:hypothetical protein TGGT1_300080 [Toxoplasma gondii GT1]KAF4638119.1 hypothetical protein TGRH88_057280 [Toxoplasma gondii]KFG34602.1 hypothetical protein TGFOU_300080 [Toxoplasma gondii FOU]PUA83724.1 hypothetical protein TGBR9_300080 [Toxoplasma gondii TgCATBr9]RQX66778.1 hypothetical protein TGCAST_300080 [Toxoplasma gondii CAST]
MDNQSFLFASDRRTVLTARVAERQQTLRFSVSVRNAFFHAQRSGTVEEKVHERCFGLSRKPSFLSECQCLMYGQIPTQMGQLTLDGVHVRTFFVCVNMHAFSTFPKPTGAQRGGLLRGSIITRCWVLSQCEATFQRKAPVVPQQQQIKIRR